MSGGNSTGLGSALSDLIAGASKNSAFPVQTREGLRWLAGPPEPVVSLRWGLYSFVPSLRALDLLVARASGAQEESFAESAKKKQLPIRGLGIIAKLSALPETVSKVE